MGSELGSPGAESKLCAGDQQRWPARRAAVLQDDDAAAGSIQHHGACAMAGKARESGREGPGSVSGRGAGVTVAAVDGQMNLGLRSVRRRWRE